MQLFLKCLNSKHPHTCYTTCIIHVHVTTHMNNKRTCTTYKANSICFRFPYLYVSLHIKKSSK